MPRYFFDCFDGRGFHGDQYGVDLVDADEAADHGACLVTELLGETSGSFGARSVSVMVRSAEGEQVYVAHCNFSGFRALA